MTGQLAKVIPFPQRPPLVLPPDPDVAIARLLIRHTHMTAARLAAMTGGSASGVVAALRALEAGQ